MRFRVLKEMLEEQCGKEEARRRIICTTDRCKGTLKQLADREGYETFVVPDDVGGRYSVLTAVGLLPIAVSGADISALMEGAAWARDTYRHADVQANACYQYAAVRNLLYRKGKEIELLVSYEPRFAMMSECGSSSTARARGRIRKGFSPLRRYFPPICIRWGSISRTAAAICLKPLSWWKNLPGKSRWQRNRKTLTA